jgi:type I restriction enzyme, R subunit
MAKNLEYYVSLSEVRARWPSATERADIVEQVAEHSVDFQTVAGQAGKPDADPSGVLCHLAFPPAGTDEASGRSRILTRRQRADRVKKQQVAFFGYFAPKARQILNDLLEKYAADGELQFTFPDVLRVPPIPGSGNVVEIGTLFGGPR